MRILAFAFLPVCLMTFLAACVHTQPAATAASSGDTCPLLDAGPPPACPEGCRWNGTECRRDSGIIIYGEKPISPPPPPPPPPPPSR